MLSVFDKNLWIETIELGESSMCFTNLISYVYNSKTPTQIPIFKTQLSFYIKENYI